MPASRGPCGTRTRPTSTTARKKIRPGLVMSKSPPTATRPGRRARIRKGRSPIRRSTSSPRWYRQILGGPRQSRAGLCRRLLNRSTTRSICRGRRQPSAITSAPISGASKFRALSRARRLHPRGATDSQLVRRPVRQRLSEALPVRIRRLRLHASPPAVRRQHGRAGSALRQTAGAGRTLEQFIETCLLVEKVRPCTATSASARNISSRTTWTPNNGPTSPIRSWTR